MYINARKHQRLLINYIPNNVCAHSIANSTPSCLCGISFCLSLGYKGVRGAVFKDPHI